MARLAPSREARQPSFAPDTHGPRASGCQRSRHPATATNPPPPVHTRAAVPADLPAPPRTGSRRPPVHAPADRAGRPFTPTRPPPRIPGPRPPRGAPFLLGPYNAASSAAISRPPPPRRAPRRTTSPSPDLSPARPPPARGHGLAQPLATCIACPPPARRSPPGIPPRHTRHHIQPARCFRRRLGHLLQRRIPRDGRSGR